MWKDLTRVEKREAMVPASDVKHTIFTAKQIFVQFWRKQTIACSVQKYYASSALSATVLASCSWNAICVSIEKNDPPKTGDATASIPFALFQIQVPKSSTAEELIYAAWKIE